MTRVPTNTKWAEWIDDECVAIDAAGQWRTVRDFDCAGPAGDLLVDGSRHEVVSFASNDYLGLSQHPDVKAAAHDAIDRWGTGSGAARLIVGSRPVHDELEDELADWRQSEAALLFPTGFATNLGVMTTFGGPGVRILSDELNHASIIDGCKLSRATIDVYRHRDLHHLSSLLQDPGGADRTMVVTDTVFSMDGDLAPLDEIVELCSKHRALLVIDEAHAVLGPNPKLRDVKGLDVVRIGTLSKTFGALGGFAAGSRRAVELLTNRARSFIFTTASTPADAAAALAAVRVCRSETGDHLLDHLRGLIEVLAPGHPSPIVPIVVGNEDDALKASAALLDRGLLVPAIRPPTVPTGTSRLRVALSSAHTFEQVERLKLALNDLGLTLATT